MSKFEVGNVVRLKSGSLAMTVADVDEDEVYCMYFDGHAVLEAEMPHEVLELCEPDVYQVTVVGNDDKVIVCPLTGIMYPIVDGEPVNDITPPALSVPSAE